jgi:hypothetical protein
MPKQSIENSNIRFKPTISSVNNTTEPDEESVARLAYILWAERGRPEGSPDDDWFRALELLRGGRAVMSAATLV